MTHHVTMKTNYSCKKTFHRKSDVRFFAIFFSHDLCDEKLFCQFFYSRIFACKKNIAKKSIYHTLLENLFFVIETVLYLSVTTFFECEMNISFINTITGLKNMEDCRDRRFQIKRYFNNQTFINVNTNNHANQN